MTPLVYSRLPIKKTLALTWCELVDEETYRSFFQIHYPELYRQIRFWTYGGFAHSRDAHLIFICRGHEPINFPELRR